MEADSELKEGEGQVEGEANEGETETKRGSVAS